MSKIKVITFLSDSHKILFDKYFLPTLPDNADLDVHHIPQVCESGEYHGDKWIDAMLMKQDIIIKALESHIGDVIVYCDADIAFTSPTAISQMVAELGPLDLVCQDDGDGNNYCAGCMCMRSSQLLVDFFRSVRSLAVQYPGDQVPMNACLRDPDCPRISYGFLSHKFWNVCQIYHGRQYIEGPVEIPDQTFLVHANWTVGIANKMTILDAALLLFQKNLQKK
jgi:hypothetical protein